MEQYEIDISDLNFGNFMLDRWLSDEQGFWKTLVNNFPCQICMVDVYKRMVKSRDIAKGADEDLSSDKTVTAEQEVMKWASITDPLKKARLIKAMIALATLAEKRLFVTSGI